MHRTYPIGIRLEGRRALLVGAGVVGAQKAPGLIAAGADLHVVSPDLHPRLHDAAAKGRLTWHQRVFHDDDIKGAFVVVAATNFPEVNRRVFELCDAAGKLVNVVDDIPLCNFFVPAVAESGPVQVAISTGGSSPVLAGQLRRRIQAELLGPETGELAEWIGIWRERLKQQLGDFETKKRFWNEVVDSDIPDLIAQGKRSEAEARLHQILNSYTLAATG